MNSIDLGLLGDANSLGLIGLPTVARYQLSATMADRLISRLHVAVMISATAI